MSQARLPLQMCTILYGCLTLCISFCQLYAGTVRNPCVRRCMIWDIPGWP